MKGLISIISTITGLCVISCASSLDDVTISTNPQTSLNEEKITVLDELSSGIQLVKPESLTDGVIIGRQLENPYSLKVMQKAHRKLYPATKNASDTLLPNCAYIRFLPTDAEDINYLCDSELELFNYPLDYEIIGDPSDYHDASLSENQITWQYTVISINDPIPPVDHEILDLGYIPDDRETELEEEAIISTGAGLNYVIPGSSGCIKIYTEDETLSNPYVGVKGVKIRARSFLKIRTGYTDENGNYTIQGYGDFHYDPRFEIRWENRHGFTEGHGLALTLPRSTDLGASRSKIITKTEDPKSWSLAAVNNAGDDWFNYCSTNQLTPPSNNLRIWVLESGMGACPMLHHGTVYHLQISRIISLLTCLDESSIASSLYSILESLVSLLGPDIVINGSDYMSYKKISSLITHELAHASHFQRVGHFESQRAEWWADVVDYEAGQIISSLGSSPYGDRPHWGSGPCGVTEMWAYATQSIVFNHSVSPGLYWFNPEALYNLFMLHGFTMNDFEECLNANVRSVDDFIEVLIGRFPEHESIIRNSFM